MKSQHEKGTAFRALHERPGAFVIPNPWDAGSARLLAGLGFEALTTSSYATAAVRGRRDGQLGRDGALAEFGAIAGAVDLPVAADLGNGYGPAPADAAATIRAAAAAGLVGGSIEDATGDAKRPLYDFNLAVERVAAAVEAARTLSFPFVLTARSEGCVRGGLGLDEIIRRLQAFEKAGADVLFAPGLPDLAAVRAVCAAVAKPVNFMAGIKGRSFPVADLVAAGVKRISVAASFYRAAMTGLLDAAREVRERGTFAYTDRAVASAEFERLMGW